MLADTKARAVAHYTALAAEADALAASRRANPGRATNPTVDDCAALNAANERVAQRAEAAVWLVLALVIGVPMGWWLAEWASCGVC